jgi:hypothetical protein
MVEPELEEYMFVGFLRDFQLISTEARQVFCASAIQHASHNSEACFIFSLWERPEALSFINIGEISEGAFMTLAFGKNFS